MVLSLHLGVFVKGILCSLTSSLCVWKPSVLCCWQQNRVGLSQGFLLLGVGCVSTTYSSQTTVCYSVRRTLLNVLIYTLLNLYEQASGQRLNLEKTSIFFSKKTPLTDQNLILQALGVQASNCFEKYLGLPALVGRSRRLAFMFVKDRIWNRISNQKHKLLSQAGKEMLLKVVAQSIPTYTMSVFLLPKTLLCDINAMLQWYWWSYHEKEASIHWVKWKKMGIAKD